MAREEVDPDQDEEVEDREEPTFCGNRGRKCRNVFGHCDYHTDMGDQEYHERIDRKLTEEG